MIKRLFLLLVFLTATAFGKPNPLLLISIDGFRWDYFDKFPTPNLHQIAKEGVRVRRLKPVFPSLTFPNHYTIVTGLYPESHGILGNEFWCPAAEKSFSVKDEETLEDPTWWEGEPIWITAQEQGLKTAPLFWPGSNTKIKGVYPTYHERFVAKTPPSAEIKKVLQWLELPEKDRPSFLTMYFDKVDEIGHLYGPHSKEVGDAVAEIDASIGTLLAEFKKRHLAGKVNLLIVSDHGMAAVEPKNVVPLYEWKTFSKTRVTGGGAYAQIWPLKSETDISPMLTELKSFSHNMKVYMKPETPDSLHFEEHRRIAPILLIADKSWQIALKPDFEKRKGIHGYPPDLTSMHAIFIGEGPDLKKGYERDALDNIHLYELMCHLLKIKPSRNDGMFPEVKEFLAKG